MLYFAPSFDVVLKMIVCTEGARKRQCASIVLKNSCIRSQLNGHRCSIGRGAGALWVILNGPWWSGLQEGYDR